MSSQRHRALGAAFGAVLAALVGGAVWAAPDSQTVADIATSAAKAARSGDFRSAVEQLQEALQRARGQAALQVRRAVVIQTPPEGLGRYVPAPRGEVKGHQLNLYVEVANFGHKSVGPEAWNVSLKVTGYLRYADGEKKARQDLGRHQYTTRTRSGVTYLVLSLALSEKTPKADYVMELEVRDEIAGKTGRGSVKFVVP